jgi:large subunit ribosomal protein L10
MALTKEKKAAIVAEVATIANSAHSAIAFNYKGIESNDMNTLRSVARKEGVRIQVVKNTLARRAVSGTDFECMQDSLTGSLVLMFSMEDPGAGARILKDFLKIHKDVEVQVISISGKLLASNELDVLAKMPTKDQAISMLMSVIKAPVTKLVRTLAEPHAKLVRTIAAVRDSKG